VEREMGRKVWEPDYDKVAQWLYEGIPPEIRDKVVLKLLGVDSLDKAILALTKAREQQKQDREG